MDVPVKNCSRCLGLGVIVYGSDTEGGREVVRCGCVVERVKGYVAGQCEGQERACDHHGAV